MAEAPGIASVTSGTPRPEWLRVEGLRKTRGAQMLFDTVGFHVPAGRTLAINGVSGCGKTTLLKIIAGLISADAGSIILGGEDIAALPAQRRNTVYLYQEPLLFPHLDVFENIAFGLRLRKLGKTDIRNKVTAMLAELELVGLERRRPGELSGGQKQRVAFGRALVVEPALLLLDEPFSNLDPGTRTTMQALFKRVVTEHGMTSVFVTHDLKESLLMGDSFAQMREGALRYYADRDAFCADPASGVAREAEFWARLHAAPDARERAANQSSA